MADVPLKEYVDRRFEELDKRVMALNEARHQNMAGLAVVISIIALVVAATDIAVWAFRK